MSRRSIRLENIALSLADITILLTFLGAVIVPVAIAGVFIAHAIFGMSSTTVTIVMGVAASPLILSAFTMGAEAILYRAAMRTRG